MDDGALITILLHASKHVSSHDLATHVSFHWVLEDCDIVFVESESVLIVAIFPS